MRIVLVGAGAVGTRAARQLVATETAPEVRSLLIVDKNQSRATEVATSLGRVARVVPDIDAALADGADAVLLACPGPHGVLAEKAVRAAASVVSTSDDPRAIDELRALDPMATSAGRTIAIGAGFMPGMTDLLARHAADELTSVEEVHVAKAGTGGPACARQHHWALAAPMREWRDGEWVERRSGSGRELCWFPDPIGGLDCYRAALGDPVLLRAAFPDASRITARVAATRRDRVTAHLPMMRRPHPEGRLGAVRVEVRGWRDGVSDTKVLGAIDRPAVAGGCVAAIAVSWAVAGRFVGPGAGGLGELVESPTSFLGELAARGVRAAVFEGAGA